MSGTRITRDRSGRWGYVARHKSGAMGFGATAERARADLADAIARDRAFEALMASSPWWPEMVDRLAILETLLSETGL